MHNAYNIWYISMESSYRNHAFFENSITRLKDDRL